MANFLVSIMMISFVGIFIGVALLCTRVYRTRGRWITVSSLSCLLTIVVLIIVGGTINGEKKREAVAAGFESASDLSSAQKAGIETPEEWSRYKALQAKRAAIAQAADDRERAEQEAAAAVLAAQAEAVKQREQEEAEALRRQARAAREQRRSPEKFLRMRSMRSEKTAFDTVMVVSFTLQNTLDFDVKDITVRCIHTSASGTTIDRNTGIIYEVFRARASRHVNEFIMGFIHSQVAQTQCEITDAVAM